MQNENVSSNNAIISSGTNSVQPNIVQYHNIDQEYITITKDKLINKLNNHLSNAESKKTWWAPFGILVTLILVPITTQFKPTMGISAPILQAMCYWGIIIFIVLTLFTGWKSFKARKTSTNTIVSEIIAESKQ